QRAEFIERHFGQEDFSFLCNNSARQLARLRSGTPLLRGCRTGRGKLLLCWSYRKETSARMHGLLIGCSTRDLSKRFRLQERLSCARSKPIPSLSPTTLNQ